MDHLVRSVPGGVVEWKIINVGGSAGLVFEYPVPSYRSVVAHTLLQTRPAYSIIYIPVSMVQGVLLVDDGPLGLGVVGLQQLVS